MGAFKSLTSQDVIITPLVTHKSLTFNGGTAISESGMVRCIGVNTSFGSTTDITYSTPQPVSASLVYASAKQLYYSNQLPNPEGETIQTDMDGNIIEGGATLNVHSRFDNYLQTTLSQSRYFPTSSDAQIGVLSIPSQLYGDYINPNSFYFKWKWQTGVYKIVVDDGEGRLLLSGSTTPAGTISYPHGLAIITQFPAPTTSTVPSFSSSIDVTCSFQSSIVIYETQYKCTIRESEFNYSLNPTMFSGSGYISPLATTGSLDTSGKTWDFVTGSSFAPYITAVGLYDDDQQLLAVGKLAQPVPTTRTTDMTIVVNLDR
jgi:hypothetical protein